MACPFFFPVERLDHSAGPRASMLPLGDFYAGQCHADGGHPDEGMLQRWCNLGYARGLCPHFPSGGAPDAVRFAMARDDGASLSLSWVTQKNHYPVEHGELEYSLPARRFTAPHASAVIQRQAQAYLESYRRRKP